MGFHRPVKSALTSAVKLGLSLSILYVLFRQFPLSETLAFMSAMNLPLFVGACLVGTLSIFLSAVRWHGLLKGIGYDYDLWLVSKLTFIGFFFNIYLPGGIAGDIARSFMAPTTSESKQDHVAKIGMTVMTDRLLGLLSLALMAAVGLLIGFGPLSQTPVIPVFLGISLLLGLLTIFLFSNRIKKNITTYFLSKLPGYGRIKDKLTSVNDVLKTYRKNSAILSRACAISLASQTCVIIYFFLLSRALGFQIPLIYLIAYIPIIEAVSALPISQGGIGIRETAAIVLFSTLGLTAPQIMSLTLLSFVLLMIVGSLGGILFIADKLSKRLVPQT